MADQPLDLGSDLSMASVASAHARALAVHRAGQLPERLDLAGVNHCDSSGLALLLELKSWASAAGQALEFHNPPDSLRVLAELSQADTLLGWDQEKQ